MTHLEVLEQTQRLVNTPMVNWQAEVTSFNPQDLREISDNLDAIIVRASALRAYVNAASQISTHQEAVKATNRFATKIRKMLGYAYPKTDMSF